jgi:hypothetical protein
MRMLRKNLIFRFHVIGGEIFPSTRAGNVIEQEERRNGGRRSQQKVPEK